MAGHSSKFTLNRFPFPEKADFPVGIGGENRATNGRDSINLWNLEGRPWQRGRCNVRSTCISDSDQITFAKNRKVDRFLDDGHAIHVTWNDASRATIGRRVVSMPCHFPISLISFLFFLLGHQFEPVARCSLRTEMKRTDTATENKAPEINNGISFLWSYNKWNS